MTIALTSAASAQSFNIDMDFDFHPALGGGVPSSVFGAAACQPGYWNGVGSLVGEPIPLNSIDGKPSNVTLLRAADSPGGIGGFNFKGNTGDYALLLNDAEGVATLVSGGTLTYTFSGLSPGQYNVYTYAANRAGIQINTPVHVPEALKSSTQVVTGPMPGNAFEYLLTHSIHRVLVTKGEDIHVTITQPPQSHTAMHVNGIQIVAVPEPSSALACAFGAALVLLRMYRSQSRFGTEVIT